MFMIPQICAVFHPGKLFRVAHQNLVFRVSYILGIPVTDTVNEERRYFSRVFCSSVDEALTADLLLKLTPDLRGLRLGVSVREP